MDGWGSFQASVGVDGFGVAPAQILIGIAGLGIAAAFVAFFKRN